MATQKCDFVSLWSKNGQNSFRELTDFYIFLLLNFESYHFFAHFPQKCHKARQWFMVSKCATKSTISFEAIARQKVAVQLRIWHGLLTTWLWVLKNVLKKHFWLSFLECKIFVFVENVCVHQSCSNNIILPLG